MYDRILKISPSNTTSFFLFGPRGTGKTSWLQAAFKTALYIDLLQADQYQRLSVHPEALEHLIPQDFDDWVIIDEIQRIPELLNTVHRLMESSGVKFILTGSSTRSLRQQGVNLLGGRAWVCYMHPFVMEELGKDFQFEQALRYGLLPVIWGASDPDLQLKSYLQTYIREEVFQESLVRNLPGFSKFLEVASFSQGSMVNHSEIARECGLHRQVISDYFNILEDLLLACRLPVFARREKRRLVKKNKFFFFDCGVYQALRPRGLLDSASEIEGPALETLFLQSVRALNDCLSLDYNLYFWQTSHGQEVDFVLYGPQGFIAVEIKRTKNITPKALSGLRLFHEDYPEARLLLLYMGELEEYHQEVTVIPFQKALHQLLDILQSK